MIYRLISVWRDAEEPDSPVMRAAYDYSTEQEAESSIVSTVEAGVARFSVQVEPMDNGAHLIATFVPIARVVGWFIWELPDDTPMWSIGDFHRG